MILLLIYVIALHVLPSHSKGELDKMIIPKHYDINILINTNDYPPQYFSGRVCIKIKSRTATRLVKLHSKKEFGVNVTEGVILEETRRVFRPQPVGIESTEHDERSGILNITLKTPMIPKKTYKLCLNFNGEFKDKFGYVLWKSSNGKGYILAANSRRQSLFPCFDEPSMRATFKMSVETTKKEQIAKKGEFFTQILGFTSKTTHTSQKPIIHKLKNNFPPSQIPFVLTSAELELTKHVYSKNWRAVYKSIPENMERVEFREDMKIDTKSFMNNLLLEVDMIVLQTEKYFVTKWRTTTISRRELHEPDILKRKFNIYIRFTRMIFGGLISPVESSEDWMYKAFAEGLAQVQIQEVSPDYMWTRFSDSVDRNLANGIDVFQKEINAVEKGVLMLRTIYIYEGHNTFMNKMKKIISKFKYGSVPPISLIAELGPLKTTGPKIKLTLREKMKRLLPFSNTKQRTRAKDIDLSLFAVRYMLRPSYALVTVTPQPSGVYLMEQEPFNGIFKDKIQNSNSSSNNCWDIPLPYAIFDINNEKKNYENWEYWMNCKNKVEVPFRFGDRDVFILNYKCTGFYRVKYHPDLWTKIVNFLHKYRSAVHPYSRACIVNDALSLAWMGYYEYSDVLKLLTFLKEEDDLTVWRAFFLGVSDLNEILLPKEETYQKFQGFINEIIDAKFKKQYNNYFDTLDENSKIEISHTDALFHKWACTIARNQHCRKQAIEKFDKWMKGPFEIIDKKKLMKIRFKGEPTEKRIIVYTVMCTVLSERTNDDKKWNEKIECFDNLLHNDYQNMNYRREYLYALQCIKDKNTIERVLKWSTEYTEGVATKAEKKQAFLSLAKGKDSFQPTLSYYTNKDNFQKIAEYHDDLKFHLAVIAVLVPRMTPDQLTQMEEFINNLRNLKRKSAVKAALDVSKTGLTTRNRWLNDNEAKLQSFLTNKTNKNLQ